MFSGAFTALVTPFDGDRVDEPKLREQIEFQIKGGISGLVPVGTTGESPTLSFEEHERVIAVAVEASAGRVPIIAGTGANATSEALHLHRFAKSAGATACLSVNPYYNKPSQEGLYRHFMTLAEAVELPIVLYNIPGRTGITMSAQTVARLREAAPERIVAIKEACGSLDMVSEIKSRCDIPILSGDDSLTLPMMAIGGVGVISVASNLLPEPVSRMTRLALAGDFAAAASIHYALFPLIKTLFLDGNPGGIKHAMKLAGRDGGEVRLPLVGVDEATQKAIAAQFARISGQFATR
jgi:4-hydroxy-tetrahydrodipicolinate synthase